MRGKLPWILAAAALYAVALYIFFPLTSGHPFAYDEADYMWAGKQGVWANFTDRHALSIVEFVSKGIELYRNPDRRAEFSRFIRDRGDIGLYRHYHGPMYAYWLAFLHNTGVTREEVFRGAGLAIHLATATVILLGFWAAFPRLPRVAGLVACAVFLFQRTSMTAAMSITQHVLFTFFIVAGLFAASMFFRNYETRWLYATMALLAACFATVETTAVFVIALVVALAIDHRRARQKWPTLRSSALAMAKAVGVFVLTLLVLWPMAVLELAIAKGFLTLMYIAVARKTFSPMSPAELWRAMFAATPTEFSLLLAGVLAAVIFWWRSPHRAEMLPWIAFVLTFLLITLKVTAPYTYYFAPLTAAAAVLTGVAFGVAWQRWGMAARLVLPILVAASIIGTAAEWARVAKEVRDEQPYHRAVLRFVRQSPIHSGQWYVPYQLVPTLHYYHPEVDAVGYDYGYPLDGIIAGLRSPASAGTMLCEEPICDAVQGAAPELVTARTPLDPVGPAKKPFYVLHLRKGS